MLVNIVFFLRFALMLLCIITMVEVAINLKRSFSLKFIFELLLGAVFLANLSELIKHHFKLSFWPLSPVMLPIFLLGFSLLLLSLLTFYRIRPVFLIISLSTILIQFFINAYLFNWHFLNVDLNLNVNSVSNYLLLPSKLLIVAVYVFMYIKYGGRIIRQYKDSNLYFFAFRRWFLFIFLILIIGLSNYFVVLILPENHYYDAISKSVNHLIWVLFILFRPQFLNNSLLFVPAGKFPNSHNLSGRQITMFAGIFFNHAYYLKNEGSLDELCSLLKLSSAELTAYIYSVYGVGFSDFINKNRVNYFVDFVRTGAIHGLNLDELATKCGFNSRHQLYKAFKKFHGGNPSDLLEVVE